MRAPKTPDVQSTSGLPTLNYGETYTLKVNIGFRMEGGSSAIEFIVYYSTTFSMTKTLNYNPTVYQYGKYYMGSDGKHYVKDGFSFK